MTHVTIYFIFSSELKNKFFSILIGQIHKSGNLLKVKDELSKKEKSWDGDVERKLKKCKFE